MQISSHDLVLIRALHVIETHDDRCSPQHRKNTSEFKVLRENSVPQRNHGLKL